MACEDYYNYKRQTPGKEPLVDGINLKNACPKQIQNEVYLENNDYSDLVPKMNLSQEFPDYSFEFDRTNIDEQIDVKAIIRDINRFLEPKAEALYYRSVPKDYANILSTSSIRLENIDGKIFLVHENLYKEISSPTLNFKVSNDVHTTYIKDSVDISTITNLSASDNWIKGSHITPYKGHYRVLVHVDNPFYKSMASSKGEINYRPTTTKYFWMRVQNHHQLVLFSELLQKLIKTSKKM